MPKLPNVSKRVTLAKATEYFSNVKQPAKQKRRVWKVARCVIKQRADLIVS